MQFIFESGDYIKVITNEVLDEPYLSKEPDGYSFYWHFIRDFSEKYKFSLTSDIKQEIKKKVEYVLNLRETLNEKTDLAEYKQYFNGELNLYPFQAKAVKFIVEQKRVLLADDVGLGKSIIALGTILELVEKKGKMKFLVVVPASLRLQWLGECRKFINKEMFPDMEFHVVNKTKGERAYLYKQFKKSDNPSIMLISYDFVRSDKEALQDIPFDMIVLDEAQKLKTRRTKINKTVRKFFPNIEYKLAMTATPIENGFEDLYCISEYLDKERLCSKTYFQDRYCIINRRRLWHRNIDIFEIVGYKNLHDAKEKLAGLYVRRTIGDVEMELPAVIKNNIFLDLTDEQNRMYSEIKGEIFGEMTREDILARMIFLQEVCDSTELLKPEKKFSSKVEELKRLLEEDLKYTKTIIITHYKKFADVLERELESTNPLVITGDTNMTLRQNILSQFNADDSKRVLIGTEAIQEGINLQVANVLVNADMSWNPAKLQQRLGRLRRLTSKHKTIRMINLIVRDTIEEHILDVLYDKGQLFEQMFKKDADVQIKNLLGMKKEELMNLI